MSVVIAVGTSEVVVSLASLTAPGEIDPSPG
jgi:hypothetical protein